MTETLKALEMKEQQLALDFVKNRITIEEVITCGVILADLYKEQGVMSKAKLLRNFYELPISEVIAGTVLLGHLVDALETKIPQCPECESKDRTRPGTSYLSEKGDEDHMNAHSCRNTWHQVSKPTQEPKP